MRTWMLASVTLLLILSGGALAQMKAPDLPVGITPPAADPKACAEHNMQGRGSPAETQGRGGTDSGLSEKLAQSGGVICPPHSPDSEIRTPAPGGGETPVIPPPDAGRRAPSR